jgi:nicotinamide-nucleotide amidase
LLADTVRKRLGASWGLGETGATGPTGNRYGDAAGHTCIALIGPSFRRAITVETGSADRVGNMREFSKRALNLLLEALD